MSLSENRCPLFPGHALSEEAQNLRVLGRSGLGFRRRLALGCRGHPALGHLGCATWVATTWFANLGSCAHPTFPRAGHSDMTAPTRTGTLASEDACLPDERPAQRMAKRTCLAVVLAAGEGTRMRSARPKVLHAVANQSLLAHVLEAVGKAGGTTVAVVVGPDADAVASEAGRVLPGRRDLRAGRATRNRACRAGGQKRDRAHARRRPGDLRRYAADPAADAHPDAGGPRRRRRGRGARLPAAGPDRLWPPGVRRRRPRRHPRGARCQPGRAGASTCAMAA